MTAIMIYQFNAAAEIVLLTIKKAGATKHPHKGAAALGKVYEKDYFRINNYF